MSGPRVAGGPPSLAPGQAERWVALIGNPNTGKTTLFNALTGGRARTGNYPGVTVDKRVGTIRDTRAEPIRLLDLPGTYSLAARSPDEMVAVDVLLGRVDGTPRPGVVVVVVDATNLARNLYLVTQVMEVGLPTVVALNMVDDAAARGIAVDPEGLALRLGLPVVPTVASRGEGVDRLRAAVADAFDLPAPAPAWTWPPELRAAERAVVDALGPQGPAGVTAFDVRRALLDVGGAEEARLLSRGGAPVAHALAGARRTLEAGGVPLATLEPTVRYAWIAQVVGPALARGTPTRSTPSDRIDAVLTHRVWGTLVLALVMTLVFVAIFSGAAPVMDLFDEVIFGSLAQAVAGWSWLGDGALRSLVVDGVIAGVGSVVVFLPQILILFGFLAVLEGCGYMARAALLMDRLLRSVGLSGRSFIPMLSSFACAVPGILAARSIPDRRDRIVTVLVAPLMSCSARIPVYVLLIAAFVPPIRVAGLVNVQGLVFAGLYLLGIAVAVVVALLLRRTVLRGPPPSFLVELPPYRVPRPRVVLSRMLEQGFAFVARAGTVIFAASIVIWALSYFPRPDHPGAAEAERLARHEEAARREVAALDLETARQEQAVSAAVAQGGALGAAAGQAYAGWLAHAEARRTALADEGERLRAEAEHAAAGDALRHSVLGRAGRLCQPLFAPIGWDWKVSAAVLASFPARETVVSTLGVLYNLGQDTDEESEGLRARLRSATWEDGPRRGTPVLDLGSALALLVFFALCAQCVSTLVTIRTETGRWRWAAFAFAYMTALAWVGAFATATLTRALL